MNLVQLDLADVTVLSVQPLSNFIGTLRLNDTFVITDQNPNVGERYDVTLNTFITETRKRWITKLAFDIRFTTQEAVALKAMQVMPARAAEETDADYIERTQVPAQLQVLQSRLNMASFIDLDRTDTRAGVMVLETLGLLAEGRALEILDGPIADHEYHKDA